MNNKIVRLLTSAILLVTLTLVSACDDSFIFDNEGDCSTKVKFVFTKNRQALRSKTGEGPDAFATSVSGVHLFVFNEDTQELAFEKFESADNLIDGCMMPVDLPEGNYSFVAWCGLDSNDENNAFELQHSYTRADGDNCHIKMASESEPVHSQKYEALYHGRISNVAVSNSDISRVIELPVVKNTNDIAIWLQNPDASFDSKEYTVTYEDANGVIHFSDNSIISEDKTLRYRPHTSSLLATETEYNGDLVESGALISHISVSRLMASHEDDAKIVVRNPEGEVVFSVPFIKYVLRMQDFTDGAAKDNQWYLDCEDTYHCSFYLAGAADGTWSATRIIINNWVVVPKQNNEF